jgi:hypothetical protein
MMRKFPAVLDFETRRLRNELSMQTPSMELSLLLIGDASPSATIQLICLEDLVLPNYSLRRIKVFVSMALALEPRGVENVPTRTL